jgi:hypothetical protein
MKFVYLVGQLLSYLLWEYGGVAIVQRKQHTGRI